MKNTIFILILTSIGYFATDIYLPSLPSIAKYYATTEGYTQITLFTFLISFALTPLYFGALSDHVGRKKVMIFGIVIGIVATIFCILPVSIYWLMFSRFLQGIGMGAVTIAARAMISDLYSGEEFTKQISYITMLMPLIMALAPTVGGYLQEIFNWQAVFLFLLGYLILILVSMPILPESLQQANSTKMQKIIPAYKSIITNKKFLLCGLGMIIPSISVFSYITASPFLFQNILGLSPSAYGKLSLLVSGTIIISSYINIKLLKFLTLNTLITIGAVIILGSGILMLILHIAGIQEVWALLVPVIIFFTSVPFCIPNSIAKSLSQIKAHFGAASAILSFLQFSASSIGAAIFSILEESNNAPLAICFICCGIAVLIITYLTRCNIDDNH